MIGQHFIDILYSNTLTYRPHLHHGMRVSTWSCALDTTVEGMETPRHPRSLHGCGAIFKMR